MFLVVDDEWRAEPQTLGGDMLRSAILFEEERKEIHRLLGAPEEGREVLCLLFVFVKEPNSVPKLYEQLPEIAKLIT